MKTLIIIPAYNEEKNIEILLKKLKTLNLPADVIVINDSSDDNTCLTAKNLGFNVITNPFNMGIGGSMQTGYLYAYYNNYDIAVQVDGDGQHNPEYINSLIEPVINGKAHIVIGSRFIENKGFQSSYIRRLGIKYFSTLIYLCTGQKITDVSSGFRACNRDIISSFIKYYPADYPEPESIVYLIRKKFKIIEIPVIMNKRQNGKSSIRAFKILYYIIKVTLAILIDIMLKEP